MDKHVRVLWVALGLACRCTRTRAFVSDSGLRLHFPLTVRAAAAVVVVAVAIIVHYKSKDTPYLLIFLYFHAILGIKTMNENKWN